MQSMLLTVYASAYDLLRPLIFRSSAQAAHHRLIALLRGADRQTWLHPLLDGLRRRMMPEHPVTVGGVRLPVPLVLAAGLVKGDGFPDEARALAAVRAGRNIMPGWRTMPRMVGPVEFGSFTRWPRMGNPGVVMWRDADTRSTQNRVGLKNPGVEAAAEFLAMRRHSLPPCFGINIAVSPGVSDPDRQTDEVLAGLDAFLRRDVLPGWFTLNLSCPNTEDDPGGNQTEGLAEQLCSAAVDRLRGTGVPLWVKVGPGLSGAQYRALMRVFARVGVQAAIATNTTARPTPNDPALSAGVGGGVLHREAVEAAAALLAARQDLGAAVDVIGCGGVQDALTIRSFTAQGVQAMQYWSALVYRGPLAAALMMHAFNPEEEQS